MSKNQTDDSIFEALFRQAVIDNFYDELNALPPLDELAKEYEPSPEHKARMKKLFAGVERREKIHRAIGAGKRIAAILLISITVLFGALMFVPHVRAAIAETIISWHQEFVRFFSPAAIIDSTSMEPTYIPEGFWEEFRDEVDLSTLILFLNEAGEHILFESNRAVGVLYIDSEDALYELREINGIIYYVFIAVEYGRENSVIWDVGGWRYMLRSAVYVEYLYKMALSVVQNG